MSLTALTSSNPFPRVDLDPTRATPAEIVAAIEAAPPGAVIVPSKPRLEPPDESETLDDDEGPRFFLADEWQSRRRPELAEAFAAAYGGTIGLAPDFAMELEGEVDGVDWMGAVAWALAAGHVLVKLGEGDEWTLAAWAPGKAPPRCFPITADEITPPLEREILHACIHTWSPPYRTRSVAARLFDVAAEWPRETIRLADVALALGIVGFVDS